MGRIASPNHSDLNPCDKEQKLTYKCLNDNNFDREKCLTAMENYKYCKSFWSFVQTQRRQQGKFPLLPPVDQRDEIKKEYVALFLAEKK